MTDMSMPPVLHHDIGICAGGGSAAPGLARWLGLAATPTFAFMALLTATCSDQPNMLCATDASPLSSMGLMYLLMSAFHLAPGVRLIAKTYFWIGPLASITLASLPSIGRMSPTK